MKIGVSTKKLVCIHVNYNLKVEIYLRVCFLPTALGYTWELVLAFSYFSFVSRPNYYNPFVPHQIGALGSIWNLNWIFLPSAPWKETHSAPVSMVICSKQIKCNRTVNAPWHVRNLVFLHIKLVSLLYHQMVVMTASKLISDSVTQRNGVICNRYDWCT